MQRSSIALTVVAIVGFGVWFVCSGPSTVWKEAVATERETALIRTQSQALEQIEQERRVQAALQDQLMTAIHIQLVLSGALLITATALGVSLFVITKRRRSVHGE